MNLNDREKVICAVYMLTKDARYQWDVVKKTNDVQNMTWTRFREVFHKKYFGTVVQNNMANEFINLRKDKLTIVDYVRKFDQLSRFAPDIMMSNQSQKRKFMQGLKPGIAKYVDTGTDGPTSYADAVQRAIQSESWDVKSEEKPKIPQIPQENIERPTNLRLFGRARFPVRRGGSSNWNQNQSQ